MLKKEASKITGGLSAPGKMPEGSYNLPARACQTGAKLREIPGTPCYGCYAFKGRYNFPNVKDALTRRLESITHPQWVQALPGLVSFFALLNLIIIFLGILDPGSGKNWRSWVGSQCCVVGVKLQTSNIFLRWSTLWISPESCHLKNFLPLIKTAIASTHCGCVIDSSRLVKASLTFGKLYRPLNA